MSATITNIAPFLAAREAAKPAAALNLTVDDCDAIRRASAIAERARRAAKRLAPLEALRISNDAIERLEALLIAYPLEAIRLQLRDLMRRRAAIADAAVSPLRRELQA